MQYKLDDFYYTEKDLIGSGASGLVYKCKLIQNPQQVFVVKKVTVVCNNKEIDILNKLIQSCQNNENVVKPYLIEQKGNSLYIVMEYCQSDLEKVMKSREQPFSQEEALNIIKQISNGYKVCLYNQIIHRDLKPANILIKDNVYKLADFGEGKIIENQDQFKNQTRVGTPAFCSPQIYLGATQKAQATNKLDIYSLGMIFYYLLTNKLPFETLDKTGIKNFLDKLSAGQFKAKDYIPNIRDDIAELLESMLKFKEEDRIDWNGLINHKLLNNNSPTIKKSIKLIQPSTITIQRIVQSQQLSALEQNYVIEVFEQRKNEMAYDQRFEQIPTNFGQYERLKQYIMENRNNLIHLLPYKQDKRYGTDYIKLLFLFHKISRNEQIVFNQLNDVNILRDYLKNI